MNAATVAALGRSAARGLMTSTCTVFLPGTRVTDPVTGEVTTAQQTVWSGPCRIRPAGRVSNTLTVGGAEAFEFDYLISIPFEVSTVVEKMRVTVTASDDPALAGITVEIQKVDRGDYITSRRLACTEVT